MYTYLPILSSSLKEILRKVYEKYQDSVARFIILADDINETYKDSENYDRLYEQYLAPRVTDEVRMITLRTSEENNDINVSFLPKGKLPEYTENGTWSRKNRQVGKIGRCFQKLLVLDFSQREWEVFSNNVKAEACGCEDFEIVEGEDIRKWYCDKNYFKSAGTLGNSCMRHPDCSNYFDIYVENAKMLISKRNGLLTGRAIVWEIDGRTIMDRVYTCFDYLEGCFYDYAKQHGWVIRAYNHLLHTGESQEWLFPDNNYESRRCCDFAFELKNRYEYYPYVDSFRYLDYDNVIHSILPTNNSYYTLDSIEGYACEATEYVCARCGYRIYGSPDECPDGMVYSDYDDDYYCDDCCWWCEEFESYISDTHDAVEVYCESGCWQELPDDYVRNRIDSGDIVKVDGDYYYTTCNKIYYDDESETWRLVE